MDIQPLWEKRISRRQMHGTTGFHTHTHTQCHTADEACEIKQLTKYALCQRREPNKQEDHVYFGGLILPQVVQVLALHCGNNQSLAS